MKNVIGVFRFSLKALSCLLFLTLSIKSFAENRESEKSYRTQQIETIILCQVDSTINPSTFDYLSDCLKTSEHYLSSMLVLQLNTPGGLVSVTEKIVEKFSNSTIPIVVWAYPNGARLASAGAIISSSAHRIVMAKGTRIGAATPVELTSDLGQDQRQKALNDLAALIRSQSLQHQRPVEPFIQMLTTAKSLTDDEAFEQKISIGTAETLNELISLVNQHPIVIKKQLPYTTQIISNPQIVTLQMTLAQSFFNFLGNPQIAYLLFLIGLALLYFELSAPGGFVLGGLGLFSLTLSGISFSILPVNLGAFLLVILGGILLYLELFITSFGLLTLAAFLCFTPGLLMLFSSERGEVYLSQSMILSGLLALLLTCGALIIFFKREEKLRKMRDKEHSSATFSAHIFHQIPEQNISQIKFQGEIWNVQSDSPLKLNDEVTFNHKALAEATQLTIKVSKK